MNDKIVINNFVQYTLNNFLKIYKINEKTIKTNDKYKFRFENLEWNYKGKIIN